jgi:PD-(D/E)XK nuclease superfamily
MPLITQAKTLALGDVHRTLNLRQSRDPNFFQEWHDVPLSMSDFEKESLDRLRADLQEMREYPAHEEIVKIFALGPVLRLAGMAKYPFLPRAEHIIEIDLSYEDQDEEPVIIRGRIDILITHANLWAIVIETKRSSASVLEALPQTLTYMMASQDNAFPIYGLCTNGTDFLFVKLVKGLVNEYAISAPFAIYNPDSNQLYPVVSILKALSAIVSKQSPT